MSLEKSVQPRRINHVGAANKGENQVGASKVSEACVQSDCESVKEI